MIASALSTPASGSATGAARKGAADAGASGEDRFEQLMNPARSDGSRADAGPRAAEPRGASARASSRAEAPVSARDDGIDAEATEATERTVDGTAEAALPDQLFAMIGGWRDAAVPAPGSAAPPTGPGHGATGLLAPATPSLLLPGMVDGAAAATPLDDAAIPAPPTTATASGAATGPVPGLAMPTLPAADTAVAGAAAEAVDFAAMLEPSLDTATPDALPDFEPGERTLPPGATAPATTTTRAATAISQPALAFPTDPDAGFDDAFGARIGWLAEQRIGRAEIRLNPETLGTIDVRLQIDGNRVTAEFHSANADVRQALESSVGRLRDMLDQHGLQLAHSNVGHGGNEAARDGQGNADRGSDTARGPGEGNDPIERPARFTHTRGLLDEYA